MWTTHRRLVLACSVAGALSAGAAAHGQYDDSAMLYGEGVQAYFRGNCGRAEQYLSAALEGSSQDPRPYYFRALSLLRQGRLAEARGDMMVGAALEAQFPNRYAVGESLIRIQGHDRLLLEKFRRQARLDAAGVTPANMPYSSTESAAQRKQVVIPLEEYLRSDVPRPTAPRPIAPPPPTFAAPDKSPAANAPSSDPFRDDPQPPAARAPVVPPPPSQPVPAAAQPAGSEDPFQDAAPAQTPPAAATPPADDDEEDPFSGL